MKSLLKEISEKSIDLGDFEFTQEQVGSRWLGYPPVSDGEIKVVEDRLGVTLPDDYKAFLKITNGFSAPNGVEPAFKNVNNIDYLKNIDSYLVEVWNQ